MPIIGSLFCLAIEFHLSKGLSYWYSPQSSVSHLAIDFFEVLMASYRARTFFWQVEGLEDLKINKELKNGVI